MAYDFVSASSQDISFGDITFLDGLSTISGHAWFNADNVTQDHVIVSKSQAGSHTLQFFQDNVGSTSGRTDTFTIFIRLSGVSAKVEGAQNAASAGTWIPVGFSWEAGSATGLRLYINGSEDANSPVTTATQGSFLNNTGRKILTGA